MQKVWNIKKYDEDDVKKIMNDFHISSVLAKLIIARDIKYSDINNFLNGDLSFLKDPYLMKDMDKFVDRIDMAIKNKEKICIYGDYDVDGITSITIMYQFLTGLGAKVDYYLPDRLVEGYGINNNALLEIKKNGTNLVITVDCGITAVEEVEYAKQIGLDICVTDHHECADVLPDAIAIINPKQKDDHYPFKMHAGVGVAFKCLAAISKRYNLDDSSYLKYLDIVAIGTISDIVPLVDENRIISKYGLAQMAKTENIGLKALLKIINFKDIDSIMVSFGMAPRINACGRMGNARIAVSLLLEKDPKKANEIAMKLDELNTERQLVEKDIFDEAVQMIQKNNIDKKNSIVLYNENWHNGVIGIVASRLVNIYYKPVILLTKEHGVIRGSGRCQSGFSIYDALTECKEALIQFGGHELAAGLSIEEENISQFVNLFEEATTRRSNHLSEQVIDIDMQITKKDLTGRTIKDIMTLKPFGQSNQVPLFIYKGLKVVAIRTIKEDKHLKLTLQDERSLIEGIAFSQGSRRDELMIGSKVDVVGNIEVNTFNTPKTIQIVIQDFKKAIE
ncbi:MAG: single-stranded-DNA-specific exonuclease RecJ [Clostridia bacterium]|nr:single-stranded-DNA-specific exonuclease RecJ [Clostridia bacterium]